MAAKNVKFQSTINADWTRIDTVEGRIVGRDVMEHENKERPFILVDTDRGPVRVFQATGLDDAFAAADLGDHIRIQFLGQVLTKNKRTFNQFRSEVWSDPDDAPVTPVKATAAKTARRGKRS